jgi:putative FmdB family regulatory protein
MTRCEQVRRSPAVCDGGGSCPTPRADRTVRGTLRRMPIYEYRCRACGHTSEELRSPDLADAPLDCACGEADTVRLPSLVARNGASAALGGELPMAGGGGGPSASAGGGCCGGGCCG